MVIIHILEVTLRKRNTDQMDDWLQQALQPNANQIGMGDQYGKTMM